MNYELFDIKTDAATADILLALLSEQSFEGFENTETGLKAFIPSKDYRGAAETTFLALQKQFGFEFEKTTILPANWNEKWEKSFEPIVIGEYCAIRAPFHEPNTEVENEIVIEPKMAFGTGHHETTYMVMAAMRKFNFSLTKVLDYGCGTGILAILAAMEGSRDIDAIDYDPIATKNTQENVILNGINHINIITGDKSAIPARQYDIILANINRNVILDSLPDLYQLLTPKGHLLISGILKQDIELVNNTATANNFRQKAMNTKGKWVCVEYTRS